MNTQKLIGSALAMTALAVVGMGSAQAASPTPVTVANFSASNGFGTTAFTFDGTQLSVSPTTGLPGNLTQASLFDTGSLIFGPITETGPITTDSGGGVAANFSGGTFTFTSNKTGNPVDLMGSFLSSQLTSSAFGTGSATVLNISKVTYTGGSFLTTLPPGTDLTGGSFSLGLSGVRNSGPADGSGPTGTVGGKFNPFTASGAAGTFSAPSSAVPEPASVVPFALGGLGLLGLIARKTRRSSGAAA